MKKISGQSLITLLLIIVIAGVILGLVSYFLMVRLKTREASLQRTTLSRLVQGELEISKVVAREDWHLIDSKITETEKYHPELLTWPYRKKITINHNQATSTSSELLNFPLLINISSDSDLMNKAQDDGRDIVFTDKDKNILKFEIEKFDKSLGKLVAWVKIPHLSVLEDTEIYLYYGNSNQNLESLEDPKNVWGTNYVFVSHLKESSGSISDSTIYTNSGTNYNASYNGSSKINGGYSFNGSNSYIEVPDAEGLRINNQITIEAWIKTGSTLEEMILQKYPNSSPYPGYGLKLKADNGQVAFWSDGIGSWVNSNSGVNDNNWHYVVVTGSGSSGKFYIDGEENGSFTYAPPSSDTSHLYIGSRYGSSLFFNGLIDEVRISKISRSPQWLKTIYNNQSNPSLFYTVSSEDSSSPLLRWLLVPGTEEITFGKDTYERWIVFYKVSRDSEGNIEENYSQDRDDPSTRKAVGFAKHLSSSRQLSSDYYLTRWENEIALQKSWLGGDGVEGPTENFSDTYATSTNISVKPDTGYLELQNITSTGYLISSTFYADVWDGIAYNSIFWDGDLATGTKVELKLAVSNNPYGPWDDNNFYGSSQGCWDSDLGPNEPMEIKGVCRTQFYNSRFFRYKVILYPDSSFSFTPTVKKVIINYSP
jgi:hypothetical protein